jgi:hypothetical protein
MSIALMQDEEFFGCPVYNQGLVKNRFRRRDVPMKKCVSCGHLFEWRRKFGKNWP